jgi:hypothetical protein
MAQATASPARRRLRTLVGTAAAVAAAIVLALVVFGGGDDGDPVDGVGVAVGEAGAQAASGLRLQLNIPEGWRRLPAKETEALGRGEAVAVRRSDGSGLVTVRRQGPVRDALPALRRDLRGAFAKAMPGARITESATVRTVAGADVVLTSWRTRDSTRLHSNVVVPAGDRSFAIDAVYDGTKDATARDVRTILGGFDLGG